MKSNYGLFRKSLYASINGRLGNLIRLRKSKLLTNAERSLLDEHIKTCRNLRDEILNNYLRWRNYGTNSKKRQ